MWQLQLLLCGSGYRVFWFFGSHSVAFIFLITCCLKMFASITLTFNHSELMSKSLQVRDRIKIEFGFHLCQKMCRLTSSDYASVSRKIWCDLCDVGQN